MSFKPIDAKRDEFRKYMEQTGLLEELSKVLIKLYRCERRPENSIDFIRANLGHSLQQQNEIEHLKNDLEDARNEIGQLRRTIANLSAEKKVSSSAISATGLVSESVENVEVLPIKDEVKDASIKDEPVVEEKSQQLPASPKKEVPEPEPQATDAAVPNASENIVSNDSPPEAETANNEQSQASEPSPQQKEAEQAAVIDVTPTDQENTKSETSVRSESEPDKTDKPAEEN